MLSSNEFQGEQNRVYGTVPAKNPGEKVMKSPEAKVFSSGQYVVDLNNTHRAWLLLQKQNSEQQIQMSKTVFIPGLVGCIFQNSNLLVRRP